MATERTQLLSSGNSYRRTSVKDYSVVGSADSDLDYPKDKVSLCCSYRLAVIICCTFAMTITFAVQASMSSAMVCMLQDPVPTSSLNGTNWTTVNTNVTWVNSTDQDWKFNWDKTSQGWVLSTFFVGYYVSQLPSGIASARFGAKKVVVAGLGMTAVFQLLAVPAAYFDLGWLYADRIIVGFIDGFLYAPTFALVGQWTPRQETSLLFGIVGMGMELGDMVSFGISLFSCELTIQGGWPFVFYTMSAIGLVLALFFLLFVSDSPFDNRLMSEKEVSYMASSVPKMEEKSSKALAKIPVKDILKSMPVWAIVVSQIGSDWMYYCILTVCPTYLKEIIKLSNMEINLLSGVPFLFIIPTIYVSGYLSDRVVTNGTLSNTTVRKINDAFCKLIPAGVIIALGFLPEGYTAVAFVLNVIGATALGFAYVSWMANPVDLAPAYTGFIVGVCEVGAVWVAIVVPILVETITADKTREKWQLAFYITAGIQVMCYIFYILFASGDLQPWAFSTYSKLGYTDLEGEEVDGQLKKQTVVIETGSDGSVDSISEAKLKAEADDRRKLLTSLSLSLGGFRGTSSYEREISEENRRKAIKATERDSLLYCKEATASSANLLTGMKETSFQEEGAKKEGVSIGIQVDLIPCDFLADRESEKRYLLQHEAGLDKSGDVNGASSNQTMTNVANEMVATITAEITAIRGAENAVHTSSIMVPSNLEPVANKTKDQQDSGVTTLSLWDEIQEAEMKSKTASNSIEKAKKNGSRSHQVPAKKRNFISRLLKLGRSISDPDLEISIEKMETDHDSGDEVDGDQVVEYSTGKWATRSYDLAPRERLSYHTTAIDAPKRRAGVNSRLQTHEI